MSILLAFIVLLVRNNVEDRNGVAAAFAAVISSI